MLLENIIGQAEIKEYLIRSFKNDRISHAQMFLGPEGSGNLALAIGFAQYILCTNKEDDDACGKCPSCQKVEKLVHPDLHFTFPIFNKSTGGSNCDEFIEDFRKSVLNNPYLDLNLWRQSAAADNKQMMIPTKEAENIVSKLSLKSFEGGYKIVVIWMPELMRIETSNKLLKIIEEPPAKTLFLLVSNNHEQIITTIKSRTQLVKIPKISDYDIEEKLEDLSIPSQEIDYIVQYANGDYLKASTLASNKNVLNQHFSTFSEWMRKCYSRDYAWAMKWADEMNKSGRENIKEFIEYSSHMTRQCLIGNYTDGVLQRLTKEELGFASKFARFINDRNSIQIYEELEKAYRDISRNVYSKTVLFDLSIHMMRLLKM